MEVCWRVGWRFAWVCVLLVGGGGGCISSSLATSTGPLRPGASWSVAAHQRVHVGEEVKFDVILEKTMHRRPISPLGIADYCVVLFGDDRIEVEPDWRGHFTFSHRFIDVRPGSEIIVETKLYRQKGRRDHMKIAGQWVQSSSPYEQADKLVTKRSVRLSFYQAPIEFVLGPSDDRWLVHTGRIIIRKADGATTIVPPSQSDRPGFAFSGPDAAGRFQIRYVPSGDQLNPTGSTEAIFSIEDSTGRTVRLERMIATP